jgi:histidine ammonia-lyase
VIGIELLAALQGLDFHAPLATAPALEPVRRSVRSAIPRLDRDRMMAEDLEWAQQTVLAGTLIDGPAKELLEACLCNAPDVG